MDLKFLFGGGVEVNQITMDGFRSLKSHICSIFRMARGTDLRVTRSVEEKGKSTLNYDLGNILELNQKRLCESKFLKYSTCNILGTALDMELKLPGSVGQGRWMSSGDSHFALVGRLSMFSFFALYCYGT